MVQVRLWNGNNALCSSATMYRMILGILLVTSSSLIDMHTGGDSSRVAGAPQVIQKSAEYNQPLYMAFIDYKKVFD